MDKLINKKILIPIIALIVYFIVMAVILLPPASISFPTFLTVALTLPILFISDICFILFPIAALSVFLLSIYTLISKNYTRFNILYAFLFAIIIIGIINLNIDNLCNNKAFTLHSFGYRISWHILLGLVSIISLILIAKKKDTKIYVCSYTIALLFYLIYQIINILD